MSITWSLLIPVRAVTSPDLNLNVQITAITFVALGTSLPDTFASKIAATSEKTADNSIGNVTGSNSVNVFMGLGLPWIIASIYHQINVSCLKGQMEIK